MKIGRRQLLGLLTGTCLSPLAPRVAFAADDVTQFFLFLDGLSDELAPDTLKQTLEPFARRQIPFGIVVRPPADPAAIPAKSAGFLREVLARYPGLVELVAWAPGLAQLRPYFQMRAATSARLALETRMGLFRAEDIARFSPVTIATEADGRRMSPEAVRGAGFRNLVRLGDLGSESCAGSADCVVDNLHLSPADAPRFAEVFRARKSGGVFQLILDIDPAAGQDPAFLRDQLLLIAETIADGAQAQRLVPSLPQEQLYWQSGGGLRQLGLLLEPPPPGNAELGAAYAAMQARLAAAGHAFSRVSSAAADGPDDCRLWPRDGSGAADTSSVFGPIGVPVCAMVEPGATGLPPQLAASGVGAVFSADGIGWGGMDDTALLRMRLDLTRLDAIPTADDLEQLQRLPDMAIVLGQGAYASEAAQSGVLQLIEILQADGTAKPTSLPGMIRTVLPVDPVLELMRATRRDRAAIHVDPAAPDATERDRLRADAEQAWRFFASASHARTGMPPSTIQRSGASTSAYRVLTMWDAASVIQATMAAHRLGLIDDKEFSERVKLQLAVLPADKIGGHLLPASEIMSHRKRSLKREFNAFDTGRLLIALKALDGYGPEKGLAAPVVARWNLAAMLDDAGFPVSIERGRRETAGISHYSHYTARGFGLWGIPARSPYVDLPSGSPTDRIMSLLYLGAGFGVLGAEPALLEEIELGMDPETDVLADTLFVAQQRAHRQTGLVHCVSEGSIDRAPWFTYQGLQIDGPDAPFLVLSNGQRSAQTSETFREDTLMISAKAAFLWAVCRPCDYSRMVLQDVRAKAPIAEGGFASGIYAKSGEVTAGYTDVNTNGIILQAIAYALDERRPQIRA